MVIINMFYIYLPAVLAEVVLAVLEVMVVLILTVLAVGVDESVISVFDAAVLAGLAIPTVLLLEYGYLLNSSLPVFAAVVVTVLVVTVLVVL